ncbi:MAG: glucosamine-6-phosphate deaminase [Lactobacillus sp.]|nr:glucosamine-6-phosphate deaminase [Lactobacillus sp.]MDN6042669.1 glucosamine-6-phosphate deaminase [Lactobacillus sp.]MDN6052616.1 glucosamine-6-phosphate deaminase [Lactobacillus sp.]
MKVIVTKDKYAGGKATFDIFAEALKQGAKVLGLATGSTPLTFYQEVVASSLDFSDVISINLDEYVGLAPDNPQSYHYFMQKHLFDAKPFKASYLPDGLTQDSAAFCQQYDQLMLDHPIDVQLLGIGQNGHIAFNEPGTSFDLGTHEVQLAESTIKANARFFNDISEVPKSAICMGIKNIMAAKKIVLLAFGAEKAHAVKQLVEGAVTEAVPATVLQRHHDVTVICDEAAAAELK